MLNVGIIGGGVGGLSAGMMLKSIGCKVQIFEKRKKDSAAGVGIQISANGVRALRPFGLEDKISELADFPLCIDLIKGKTGKKLGTIPLGNEAQKLYGAGFFQFLRKDLISLLRKENLGRGVVIWYENKVLDVQQDLNGVRVTTSKGEYDNFDLVVAADGINSIVRRQVFGNPSASFLKQVAYRTVISAQDLPREFASEKTRLFLGKGKHVVSYPIRKGRLVNLVFCLDYDSYCDENWDQDTNLMEIREKFSDFSLLKKVFDTKEVVKKWGLFEHNSINTWHKNRVVLLGDACHPILPYLAQGATQAIEDALELSIRIQQSFKNHDLGKELKNYTKNRAPRVEKVRKASRLNARLFHLKNPISAFFFQLLLRLVSNTYPKILLKRFSWIYSGGPA